MISIPLGILVVVGPVAILWAIIEAALSDEGRSDAEAMFTNHGRKLPPRNPNRKKRGF